VPASRSGRRRFPAGSAKFNATYAELRIGGDPSPSADDITTTERIVRVGAVLDIPVMDHIIVTRDRARYHSMHERGTLPTP
jgi:hypothetical protein